MQRNAGELSKLSFRQTSLPDGLLVIVVCVVVVVVGTAAVKHTR